jgi:hypothetical protein
MLDRLPLCADSNQIPHRAEVTRCANRRHAGHRSLSAADVNAHGRLAARYEHSSTRGHETGHPATFRCRGPLAITSDSDTRDST